MSTKVYDGWKTNNLDQMLEELWIVAKPAVEEAIFAATVRLFRVHMFHSAEEIQQFKDKTIKDKRSYVWWDLARDLRKRFQEQYGKDERSCHDISLGLSIFLHEGAAYFYPWKGDGIGLYFDWDAILKQVPSAVPYAYWNNTDPDENVSEEEWKQRGAAWDIALEKQRLTFDLVSPTKMYYFDLFGKVMVDKFMANIDTYLEDARLMLEANNVMDSDLAQGLEFCWTKYRDLMLAAHEQPSKWAFEYVWNMVQREKASTVIP